MIESITYLSLFSFFTPKVKNKKTYLNFSIKVGFLNFKLSQLSLKIENYLFFKL
ncbi:hypothetical protein CMALT394_320014 [Carnobacterium maltaromaticum]|nr:hypothetical protein CMALT394_320014 [Carnobacterium maltaromaticum]